MASGAKSLLDTLVNAGVDTCFSNPGTSEMHFVAALDGSTVRAVLCLFEGVATGAADGYARIAGKPAATLLHLGCGLGNGLAEPAQRPQGAGADREHRRRPRDLPHAIRRAAAVRHRDGRAQLSPPGCARARRPRSPRPDAAEAVTVAIGPPGQIATLILPADVCWGEGASRRCRRRCPPRPGREPRSSTRSRAMLQSGRKVPRSCSAAGRYARTVSWRRAASRPRPAQALLRGLPDAPRSAARACPPSSASRTSPSSPRCS